MTATYLIHELLLRLVELVANVALRALGGPDHVPQTNDDFVLY